MDKKKMIAAIAAEFNIRLDENDPALIMVALYQMALQQALDELGRSGKKMIDDATADLVVKIGGLVQAGHDFEKLMIDKTKGHKVKVLADVEVEAHGIIDKVLEKIGNTMDSILTVKATQAAESLKNATSELKRVGQKLWVVGLSCSIGGALFIKIIDHILK